ncbi:hypothetical protein [Streptomyces cyaneofuscatus]|uniref:hypothetical protein n=1 Tax=Streptomyces cyaneofuscatus TaxID=66883 RepID=UPI00364EB93E
MRQRSVRVGPLLLSGAPDHTVGQGRRGEADVARPVVAQDTCGYRCPYMVVGSGASGALQQGNRGPPG